jgi:hypothetical protein
MKIPEKQLVISYVLIVIWPKKPMDIEVPQYVLLNMVFEAIVKIPYDTQIKQVFANGKK